MIATWVAAIQKASRSARAVAIIPKMQALEPAADNGAGPDTPSLPGMRGRGMRMQAILPWPNLEVSRAVVTGAHEMRLARTRRGDVSLTVYPCARPAPDVRVKIVMCGASRPDALVRVEYSLRKSLTGFISADDAAPAATLPCRR